MIVLSCAMYLLCSKQVQFVIVFMKYSLRVCDDGCVQLCCENREGKDLLTNFVINMSSTFF